jgi:hypothetical protein
VTHPSSSSAGRIEIHSSGLWALLHLRLTEALFRNVMAADELGISLVKVSFWLTPWKRSDEHLPMSHIAEITHERGLIWDSISVESSGGLNPLTIEGLPKGAAHDFVTHVRQQMNQPAPRAG